jgi:hypothetical protein
MVIGRRVTVWWRCQRIVKPPLMGKSTQYGYHVAAGRQLLDPGKDRMSIISTSSLYTRSITGQDEVNPPHLLVEAPSGATMHTCWATTSNLGLTSWAPSRRGQGDGNEFSGIMHLPSLPAVQI